MRITGGRVFDLEQGFVRRDLYTAGERIDLESGDGEVLDASGCYVIPGLVDLHFHGCLGEDFSDATPEGLSVMADYELSRGVTYICPAGMTLGEDQLMKICQNAAQHKQNVMHGAELVGVHLEGPFLSEAKKGAQNGAYLRDPDPALLERLQQASQGLVKLVTLAPERPGALEFISKAKQLGVTVSLGHTTADYATASAAYDAGARHATHLYNAMPAFGHREPGVIGAAFDHPETRVELICDGVHIHPAVVRATFRLFGKERMVLISDSLRAAGMPDGQYTLGGQDIMVKGNRGTLMDGVTLAGSVTDLMGCVKTAVSFGIPLEDAVRAASYNPARVLGIDTKAGSLDAGKEATLVLLNEKDLSIHSILQRGKLVTQ